MSVGPLDPFHNSLTWPCVSVHVQTSMDPQTAVFALHHTGQEEIEHIRLQCCCLVFVYTGPLVFLSVICHLNPTLVYQVCSRAWLPFTSGSRLRLCSSLFGLRLVGIHVPEGAAQNKTKKRQCPHLYPNGDRDCPMSKYEMVHLRFVFVALIVTLFSGYSGDVTMSHDDYKDRTRTTVYHEPPISESTTNYTT